MREQAPKWKKNFGKHISDKGLVSQIYKELLKHNDKKTKEHNLKWAKDLNRCLTKPDIQMAKGKKSI